MTGSARDRAIDTTPEYRARVVTVYPEHDKLSAVQEELAAVRDFLEAITSEGWQVCRNEDIGYRTGLQGRHIEPRWMPQDWRPIVAHHFDVDEDVLERERRAMLAGLSAKGVHRG